mmetsp:Transcript_99495/g.304187  ORF Transcript_99495/g.304187 Transcript_99495/m.304187 type:complete len:247 (-) Transcript_99495:236-976(-)
MKRTLPASPQTSRYVAASTSCVDSSAASPLPMAAPSCTAFQLVPPTGGRSVTALSATAAGEKAASRARQRRKPSSSSPWSSCSASRKRPGSSTWRPSSTERSATIAHWERQRDSKCSCWFRALSAWKSKVSRSEANTLAVQVANMFALGSTRKQLLFNQAWVSSTFSLSPVPRREPMLVPVPSRSSSCDGSLCVIGRHQEATIEARNSATRMMNGTAKRTAEPDAWRSTQNGGRSSTQHCRPSMMW